MRLIEGPVQLPYPPRACCVTNRIDGDFIDLQVVIDRPEPTRLYLKREIAEDVGRLCGMVAGSEVEKLRERLDHLTTELQHAQDILKLQAELEEQIGRERIAA